MSGHRYAYADELKPGDRLQDSGKSPVRVVLATEATPRGVAITLDSGRTLTTPGSTCFRVVRS